MPFLFSPAYVVLSFCLNFWRKARNTYKKILLEIVIKNSLTTVTIACPYTLCKFFFSFSNAYIYSFRQMCPYFSTAYQKNSGLHDPKSFHFTYFLILPQQVLQCFHTVRIHRSFIGLLDLDVYFLAVNGHFLGSRDTDLDLVTLDL